MREGLHRSAEAAAALVEANVGWATGLALSYAKQHGWPSVDNDDYVQDAMIGLMEAATSFDGRGNFRGWAWKRAVGAMVDGIRDRDEVSRGNRQKLKRGEKMVDGKGVAVQHRKWSLEHRVTGSDGGERSPGDELTLLDTLVDEERLTPEEELLWEAFLQELRLEVDSLPRKLGRVVRLYYFEGYTLREIGEKFGFTESRASQLHTDALNRLRKLYLKRLDDTQAA